MRGKNISCNLPEIVNQSDKHSLEFSRCFQPLVDSQFEKCFVLLLHISAEDRIFLCFSRPTQRPTFSSSKIYVSVYIYSMAMFTSDDRLSLVKCFQNAHLLCLGCAMRAIYDFISRWMSKTSTSDTYTIFKKIVSNYFLLFKYAYLCINQISFFHHLLRCAELLVCQWPVLIGRCPIRMSALSISAHMHYS